MDTPAGDAAPVALFHYSEEPGIAHFEPRPSKHHPFSAVWAVEASCAVNLILPRDCPRVTFGVGSCTTADDAGRWMGATTARRVIAIEAGWLDRVRACTLYEYTMPLETFVLDDAHAGYYISRAAVRPLARRVITDALAELLARQVEVRMMPSLWRLRDQVASSTLRFSISRMRKARPPDDGYMPVFPV